MSIYVTLPSNSSKTDFPDNTLTHFRTTLKNPLRLNGNYEVALAQILFPKNWKYRPDGRILVETPDGVIEVIVEFNVWESLNHLLTQLTTKMLLYGISAEFKYDQNTSKIFISVPPEISLLLTDGINNIFGFNDIKLDSADKNIFFSDVPINFNLNNINSVYVYSDICEFQLVGDTEAPLLQVVSTNNSIENYVEKIFDSPHYIPLARNNLETIEIDIRCDLGKPIQFQSGKVVVKLHFRKKSFF